MTVIGCSDVAEFTNTVQPTLQTKMLRPAKPLPARPRKIGCSRFRGLGAGIDAIGYADAAI